MNKYRFALLALLASCMDDPGELGSSVQEVINERNASVAAGHAHSCAVEADGTVSCWGRNYYGQLGNGTNVDTPAPVTVTGISTAVAVTAGKWHTCAVLADGTARCWGLGTSGQLGNAGSTSRTTPVVVSGLSGATSISGGEHHTCASLDSGQVRCWGANTYGQLGDTTTTSSLVPVIVGTPSRFGLLPLTGVTEVEAGLAFTCARRSDGGVRCWGRNQYGQLGDGTTANRAFPAAAGTLTGVGDLAVGDLHACVVMSTARARCWGHNLFGQLGDGTQTMRLAPVEVQRRLSSTSTTPVTSITAIAAGGAHTCLRAAGEMWCTGQNDDGQLGRDFSGYLELLAVASSPKIFANELAAGADHTCARVTSGDVVCVGRDTYGQVGDQNRCPATPTARITSVTSPGAARQLRRDDSRGPIYYTDGDTIDLVVETTTCARVEDVYFKWGRIAPNDPVEPDSGNSYTVLSTVDHADGRRELTVRIDFTNFEQGQTYDVSVDVASPQGTVVRSDDFTLVEAMQVTVAADAVSPTEHNGVIDLGRDEIMNEVLQGLYEKFGDHNYWTRPNTAINFYDFDYAGFELALTTTGISFWAQVKADMPGGDTCDPTAEVWGKFRIDLVNNELVTTWVEEVDVGVHWPLFCQAISLDLLDLAGWFTEVVKDDNVERKIADRIGELTSYCSQFGDCDSLVKRITHADGAVRVTLQPNFDSVTFRQPYLSSQLHADSVGDPLDRGIALPPDDAVILISGGVADGCGTQACPEVNHRFGASGLFNWNWPARVTYPNEDIDEPWGAHPPILEPWRCGDNGCAYYEGRQGPWLRQQGMRRDLAQITMPGRNVGALLARVIHADDTASPIMYAGDLVCGIDAVGGDAARLVVGRNDIPSGPMAGEYGRGDAIVTMVLMDGSVALAGACPTN